MSGGAPVLVQPDGPGRPTFVTIVVLGDSLTSGHGIGQSAAFPAVLQSKLHAARLPYRIVNHGVSGDTTAGGVRRIAAALDDETRVLVLALGINDGLRGVAVPQIKSNLAAIIRAAQAKDVRVLLCRIEALPLYGWDYTLAFRRMFEELAAEYKSLSSRSSSNRSSATCRCCRPTACIRTRPAPAPSPIGSGPTCAVGVGRDHVVSVRAAAA